MDILIIDVEKFGIKKLNGTITLRFLGNITY